MLDARALGEARRIAAAYPPEARHTPAWERTRYLTETQQLAWLIRFDPEQAAEVLSASGADAEQASRSDRLRPGANPHHGHHPG